MSRIVLPIKHSGENKKVVFDFISLLAAGETISTAVVTAITWSGTDATPSSLISGSASISSTKVTQMLTAGVAGVTYALTCTITTSTSQTLKLHGYQTISAQGIV